MPSLARRRLRLAANIFAFDEPQDAVLNRAVKLWASNDLAVEIAAFAGTPGATTLIDSVANWSSLTLSLLTPGANNTAPDPATATVRLTKTVTSFSVPAWADWQAATAQHATITATGDETALPAGKYWLVLSLQTTDSPARTITLLAGLIDIVEDGYNSGGSAPTVANTAYTKAESDARYLPTARTALTGGAATALDGEATVGLTVGTTLRAAVVSGVLGWWQLQAGTDAENAAGGIVRPDDYATSTNEKVWKQVL